MEAIYKSESALMANMWTHTLTRVALYLERNSLQEDRNRLRAENKDNSVEQKTV